MLFSSLTFLYYFLPVVLLLYFAVPRKFKNTILLIASLIFYSWGEPHYIFLMLASIFLAYIFGLLIEQKKGQPAAKVLIIVSVGINLSFLLFFKYTDFFIENFNSITGTSISLLRLTLPIGISFYTFQMISYTIDVYHNRVKAQRNLLLFGTYVSLFPQLIAGPIVRYEQIEKELCHRTHSFDQIAYGCRRFIIGLSKKVLIANSLGAFCQTFDAGSSPSVLYYWLNAIAVMLQIYFDFSGYSDMAIGLGIIFGFHFPENFNYPFLSKSLSEFWRRWHITLGHWFRDYVYIPLGGNRVSICKHLRNIFIVWFLTGMWHGASWNFILWGLFFGIMLALEKYVYRTFLEKMPSALSHLYTLFFLLLSFQLFHIESMQQLIATLSCMFGAGAVPLISATTLYYLKSNFVIFLVAVIGSTPLPKYLLTRLTSTNYGKKMLHICEIPALMLLILLVTSFLIDGSYNPFLYFRF